MINKPRLGFSWKIPILKKRHIQQIAYQIQINQWDSLNQQHIIKFVFVYGRQYLINRVYGQIGYDFEHQYLIFMNI